MSHIRQFLIVASLSFATLCNVHAFDLKVQGVDNADVENNIKQLVNVTLVQARFQRSAIKQNIAKAIRPFGYYAPTVSFLPLSKEPDSITAKIDLGPQTMIESITFSNTGDSASLQDYFPLEKNTPLIHEKYEAAKSSLLSALAGNGYLDATINDATVEVSLKNTSAAIHIDVDAGRRYKLGALRVKWDRETILDEGLITRHQHWKTGEYYSSDHMATLRTNLQSLNFVEKINLSFDKTKADDQGQSDVVARVTASGARNYSFGVGYGTDTGPRVSAGIHWRWLNANGDSLKTRVSANEFTQQGSILYDMPITAADASSWQLELAGKNERTEDTQQYSWLIGTRYLFSRGRWKYVAGLDARFDRFSIGDQNEKTNLLMPSFSARKIRFDDINYIRDGYSINFTARGGSSSLLSDIDFLQLHARLKVIQGFGEDWRFIARLEGGATLTDDFDELAPDLRFYTGGDRSIRGYKYQTISPRDANDNLIGGKNLLATSAEIEYRFAEDWAVATFVDAGTSGNNINPDSLGSGDDDAFRLSTGLGVRWFSPVGTVRLDIAVGIEDEDNPWRIHVTLGPDL